MLTPASSEQAVEVVRSHEDGTRLARWHALAEEWMASAVCSGVDEHAGAPMEGTSRRHTTVLQMCLTRSSPLAVTAGSGRGTSRRCRATPKGVRWSRHHGNMASGRVRERQATVEGGGTLVSRNAGFGLQTDVQKHLERPAGDGQGDGGSGEGQRPATAHLEGMTTGNLSCPPDT
jgi:hypothetical protein